MNIASDSDDSAFLFKNTLGKRKALNNNSKVKKLRKSDNNIDRDSENFTGAEKKENEEVKEGLVEQNKQNISNSEKWHKNDSEVDYKTDILAPECFVLSDEENPEAENEGIESSKLKDSLDFFSCPLCLKEVASEIALVSHMKLCGKRYNMTCKELLEALEHHKQQLKKKTSLKLFPKVKKTKKVKMEDNDGSTNDLALGLAMSKSLMENNLNEKEENSFITNKNSGGKNKTTLESFGFTNTGTGKKKLKNRKHNRYILRDRTRDEREKILTEKAAVVLLSQDHQLEFSSGEKKLEFSDESVHKVSHLWKLAEKENNADWYVRDIENFILNDNLTEKDGTEENHVDNVKENIDKEITELNLPRASIFQQWKKLINKKNMSDLTFRANSSIFYLHSVVLFVRFPKLLDMDLAKVFHQFDTPTIISFLQYLYCGVLDGLPRSQVENLLRLASSINFEELIDVLNILKRNLISEEYVRRSIDEKNVKNMISDDEVTSFSFGMLNLNGPLEESNEACGGDEEIPEESNREFQARHEEVENEGKDEKLPCEIQKIKERKSRSNRLGECDLEKDLFEEEENLNENCKCVETNSNEILKENEGECILISSNSSVSDNERRDEFGEVHVPDCEIPYFDPYEHFNSEIPMEDYPLSNEPEEHQNRDLVPKKISPSPIIRNWEFGTVDFFETIEELAENSLVSTLPEFCSTPVRKAHAQTSILPEDSGRKKSGIGRQRRTPCTRRKRSLANRNLAKSSIKKGRKRKENPHDEKDSKTEGEPLRNSPLNDFNQSIKFTSEETIQANEFNRNETTPSLRKEDYTEDVSPLPDYSIMNPSTIKKHLAKYGLKKSLSKNKAKRILRHIYEELHPMIDTRNGKIIKQARSEKKKSGKKTGRTRKIRKIKERNSQSLNKEKNCQAPNGNGNLFVNSSTPLEDVSIGGNVTDNSDRGAEESNMEESDSFTEEPLIGNSLDFNGLSEAIYDFIRSNSEIRRKILMYEPIWLENFRNQLYEKYNKKFKLTDLMDCLDAECITFRSEKQRATNVKRDKKSKKDIHA